MSKVKFAGEHGIELRSLYRWGQRIRRGRLASTTTCGLVEVPQVATRSWAAEVTTASGTVRLSPLATPVWAGQLIRELSRC